VNRRRIEGWFSLGVLLLVVGLALLAQGLRDDPEARVRSVTSTADAGRRGFFLLLQELGYEPVEWRRAPGELPRGEHLLYLPEWPVPWAPGKADENAEPQPNLLPSHGLEHYRDFVEQGGTLIAPLSEDMVDFLKDDLGLADAEGLVFRKNGKREQRRVRLESGETLELSLDLALVLQPFPAGSPWRELWMLEKDQGEVGAEYLVAAELPLGAGRVVLLSEDKFLDNSEIGKAQHALAGVRLVEQLGRGGGLYFDEYCLGLWEPESALALSASPRVFLLSAHALALLALFVWARAFARAFPRDPPPLAATSPLERAEALARLWKSSGRSEAAARALRRAAGARHVRKATAGELESLARSLEDPSAARG
jgi:hypothetical protein